MSTINKIQTKLILSFNLLNFYCLRSQEVRSGKSLFLVTGRPKSGTTWIGNLLGNYPNIYVDTSENQAFPRLVNYSVLHTFGDEGMSFFTERILSLRKDAFIHHLISRCNKLSPLRLGDKSPDQNLDQIFSLLPEIKVIIAVRDLRDTCVSAAFHVARTTGNYDYCFDNYPDRPTINNHFLNQYFDKYTAFSSLVRSCSME